MNARRAGFTLIELVVVLAILVIATSFVLLRLDGVTAEGRLRSAAREMAGTIRYARSFAVMSGKPSYLYYDLTSNCYYVSRTYYGDDPGAPGYVELRDVEYAWEMPRSVRLHSVTSAGHVAETDVERFDFTGLGSCMTHSIYLKGPEEQEWYTVEVNGITGRVSVVSGYKEFDSVRETLSGL